MFEVQTQYIIKQMDVETLNFLSFVFQAVETFIQEGKLNENKVTRSGATTIVLIFNVSGHIIFCLNFLRQSSIF